MLLGLFNLNLGLGNLPDILMWGALALIVYQLVKSFTSGGGSATLDSVEAAKVSLPGRLANLLTHIGSLGLPVLGPLLKDAAAGNWLALPGHVTHILDTLDNKDSRSGVLETLFWSRLEHWISDNERAQELMTYLAKKLGYTITKAPPAA